jgi:hypothetical protein
MWQQKQVRKDIVTKPSHKGTHASEIHVVVPQSPPFSSLLSLIGTNLNNSFEQKLGTHLLPEQVALFNENPLLLVRWSTKDNLVL